MSNAYHAFSAKHGGLCSSSDPFPWQPAISPCMPEFCVELSAWSLSPAPVNMRRHHIHPSTSQLCSDQTDVTTNIFQHKLLSFYCRFALRLYSFNTPPNANLRGGTFLGLRAAAGSWRGWTEVCLGLCFGAGVRFRGQISDGRVVRGQRVLQTSILSGRSLRLQRQSCRTQTHSWFNITC